MDAFSYLSVLLSIILGLAITQVLQGFRGLMLARSRVQAYWPSVAWAILLLVIDVQAWWAMYELRFRHDWSFLGFAVVLAQTVPLYLFTMVSEAIGPGTTERSAPAQRRSREAPVVRKRSSYMAHHACTSITSSRIAHATLGQ